MALPAFLMRDVMGVPAWGWAAGAVAGGAVVLLRRRTVNQTLPLTAPAQDVNQPSYTGDASGGAGGGGGIYYPNPTYQCADGSVVQDPSMCPTPTTPGPPTTGGGGSGGGTPAGCNESADFATNIRNGCVPLGGTPGGQGAGGLAPCVPGSSQTCSLQYIQSSGIYFAPGANGWIGVKFANPAAAWQQAGNNALDNFFAASASWLGQQPTQQVTPTAYSGPQPGVNGAPPALAPVVPASGAQIPGYSGGQGNSAAPVPPFQGNALDLTHMVLTG